MIKNYLKIAWRTLVKNKAFSFINILGLTIGITVCMMIFLFILNEFSFDRFHKQEKDIYRVMRGVNDMKEKVGMSFTNLSFIDGEEEIKPSVNVQIRWGDPQYIDVYKIKILAGRNVESSDTIKEFLINESYAYALGFQHPEDALNKFLKWNGSNMPIVGVRKDFHFQSMHALIEPVVFGGSIGQTFHIQLKSNNVDGTSWKNTIAEIQKVYNRMYPDEDFNLCISG